MSTQYTSKYLDKVKLQDLLVEKFGKQDFQIECKRGVWSFFIPGGKDKELSEKVSDGKSNDLILLRIPHHITEFQFTAVNMSQTRQWCLDRTLDALSSQKCLTNSMNAGAVKLHTLSPTAIANGACRYQRHSIDHAKDIENLLATDSRSNSNQGFAACLVCIHQNHSYQPLNATRDCLQALTNHLDISAEFLDIMSSFYQKVTNTEETYCAPLVTQETSKLFEYMYILRYPEQNHRNDEDSWSIRQTAVYHQLHKSTGKSVYIILSPLAESAGETALSTWFKDLHGLQGPTSHAFAVNRILLNTYRAGWRSYMSFYEKKIEKLCMKMMSIGLVIVDAVTPDEMADLFYFESRLLPLASAAVAADRLLVDLQHCSQRWPAHLRNTGPSAKIEEEVEWLENHRSKMTACSSHATALLIKCERAVQLLDRILNLKSQQIAQQQNTNILALTKSTVDDSATVRVMTAITLVYLSCTVVATVFSTPFFELEDKDKSLTISPDFWVYAAVSAPLTIVTIVYWRWSLAKKRRQRQIAGVMDRVSMV